MTKVIVLGALSAVAEQTARLYAAEGAELMLVGRDRARLDAVAADLKVRGAVRAEVETMDLAAEAGEARFQGLIQALGGVDHVILAYGVLGGAEVEADLGAARALLDVDFTSAAIWALAAANQLERQKGGALVAIGSVAGDRGRQSNYVYGAAKAGLAVLMQGLAHRLSRSGARAVVVKPGFIDTPMTAHIAKGGPLWARPEAIAAIVRRAADKGGPIVYAPGFWRLILLIIRTVPSPVMHKTQL
ncbi:MAG TPA: SDR family NAD(P)-dependent oxidoreductase [Caulobacteraceae bacterium]